MINDFIKILQNPPEVLSNEQLNTILFVSEKFPEFKVAHVLLKNYPADIFRIEYWNKAELTTLNIKELIESFNEDQKINNTEHTQKIHKDLHEKITEQKIIIREFFERY